MQFEQTKNKNVAYENRDRQNCLTSGNRKQQSETEKQILTTDKKYCINEEMQLPKPIQKRSQYSSWMMEQDN